MIFRRYLTFSEPRILQIVVFALLFAHTLWVANHLRWVANDRVNPWKLGGYGMYTVPFSRVYLDIVDARTGDAIKRPTKRIFELIATEGYGRFLRCMHLSPKMLKSYYEEHEGLRGRDLNFVVSEFRFVRDPVGLVRREQGRVHVQWIDSGDHFVYVSSFCGDEVFGEVSMNAGD